MRALFRRSFPHTNMSCTDIFTRLPLFLCLCSFLLPVSCKSSLLRKELAKTYNQELKSKRYKVLQNIYSPFPNEVALDSTPSKRILFRKGEKVKIILENGAQWVRMRAFLADSDLEKDSGRIILYIVSGLKARKKKGKKQSLSREELDIEISRFLKKI